MIALSTAYKEALIALNIKNIKAYKSLQANCKHSENLLLSLDSLLEENNLNLEDNEAYCVIIGPGSFTGLRISVALLKGLLAGENKKNILPLTTFDLIAYSYIKNYSPKQNFVCVINALSGKYFVCEYNFNGDKIGQEKMVLQQEYDNLNIKRVGLLEENIAEEVVSPSAEELLELATKKFSSKKLITALDLAPLYIRKSQAEDSLEENEKK